MTHKITVAHLRYDVNNRYVLKNTEINQKYFLKFFPTSTFVITDSIKALHCYRNNINNTREFLAFINVYSKINNVITCKVKYKIYF